MHTNLAEKIHELALPAIGEAFGGGYLAALMPAPEGHQFALIVAPKAEGDKDDLEWKDEWSKTEGTSSAIDGLANSNAMNNDEHPAAQFCRGLQIGGHSDWYLPASAEQAAIWANLGPNHTPVAAFQKGAPEAYDLAWYWSSTEFDSGYAWLQYFGVGYLGGGGEGYQGRVRAVRKVFI
jgi:hypothetical protein